MFDFCRIISNKRIWIWIWIWTEGISGAEITQNILHLENVAATHNLQWYRPILRVGSTEIIWW